MCGAILTSRTNTEQPLQRELCQHVGTQRRQATVFPYLPSRDLGSDTLLTLFWLSRVNKPWKANGL